MKCFLTLITILFLAWVSIACDCIMTPIESHIKETSYIVTGQVIALLDTREEEHYYLTFDTTRSYQVKIKIMDSYKGGFAEGQIIELGSDYSDCSFYFKRAEKYLLFLTKDKNSEKYFQRTCSYSEKLENASNYIAAIEKQTKY